MKNNIRDTNNKELQEIIANTILLPDISNLDCLHEPITASFGLLLLWVAQMGARKGVNLESRRKRILTVVPHAVNDVNDVVLNGSIARDRAIC